MLNFTATARGPKRGPNTGFNSGLPHEDAASSEFPATKATQLHFSNLWPLDSALKGNASNNTSKSVFIPSKMLSGALEFQVGRFWVVVLGGCL